MFLKKWLQKILVISVALLTLGLITPNHEIWDVLEHGQSSNRTQESNLSNVQQQLESVTANDSTTKVEPTEQNLDTILFVAKEQSYIKFGSRITPVISNEFEEKIFPKIEEAIEATLIDYNEETIKNLAISEHPSGQYAEKIFNISDGISGQELIRFHVRTENRPLEGYYYNFHYHTFKDQFVAHHHIGDIYWSKNTPPKWLS